MKEEMLDKCCCSQLTFIELLDAAYIASRVKAMHEKFETPHGTSEIKIFKYPDGALAMELAVFTRQANPHQQIETFCIGKTKTELAFAFGALLEYRFEIKPINYDGKKSLQGDVSYGLASGTENLFIPYDTRKAILAAIESI